MNIKEWQKACEEGWAPRKYDILCRSEQRSLKHNPDPNATVRHHLRDTEEQRKYNDEHYELWGHNLDGTFEYGKYIIFCTAEEHHSVWHNVSGENNPMYGKPGTNLGKPGTNLGKTFSEEHRRKISESNTGREVSTETREKISETLKNSDKHPWRGKHLPDYVKRKLSESRTGDKHWFYGKHLSEEHRVSIGKSLLGHATSESTKKKISDTLKGHTVSEDTKQKISENRKGKGCRPCSEDTKKKISDKKKFISEMYSKYKACGGLLKWNYFNKYFKEVYNCDTDTFNLEFVI